jgi:beta-1,4-galactosyltransferase 1
MPILWKLIAILLGCWLLFMTIVVVQKRHTGLSLNPLCEPFDPFSDDSAEVEDQNSHHARIESHGLKSTWYASKYHHIPSQNVELTPRNARPRRPEIGGKSRAVGDSSIAATAASRDQPPWVLVVPYRGRPMHLSVFLDIMPTFLNFSGFSRFNIVVVEQFDAETPFNRAKLFNVAIDLFKSRVSYFCFHDIDMIPAHPDAGEWYSFPSKPTHLAVNLQAFGFKLPYRRYVGGILCMSNAHINRVNGFSNLFWAWGGEDDDMATRLELAKLTVKRPPVAYFWSLQRGHTIRDKSNLEENKRLIDTKSVASRYKTEGLNSLQYKIVDRATRADHEWILVDLLAPANKTGPH